MAWRAAAKIVVAAGEALTKAFARAVREEFQSKFSLLNRLTVNSIVIIFFAIMLIS